MEVVQGVSVKNGWLEYYFLIGEAYTPGRLTSGTYSHHPYGKEYHLNQTSRELCSMLIFQGVFSGGELLVSGRVTLFHNCCTPDWYC